jgi:outer membrane lipoprotein SlyB
MASVEDILLARAMQDQEGYPSTGEAASAGAALGALTGVAAGQPAHLLGKLINKGRQAPGGGAFVPRKFKAGPRMAGALVGAITGGALGPGVKAIAEQQSPAARILAKIQSGQQITIEDQMMLENILAETYSRMA